jgi:hypothetical protein
VSTGTLVRTSRNRANLLGVDTGRLGIHHAADSVASSCTFHCLVSLNHAGWGLLESSVAVVAITVLLLGAHGSQVELVIGLWACCNSLQGFHTYSPAVLDSKLSAAAMIDG